MSNYNSPIIRDEDIHNLAAQIIATITTDAEHNDIIALAESCTGGMVAAALTDIAGSSVALDRAFVTYSNDAKMDMLGVGADTLAVYGAVSPQTATEMVTGVLAAAPQASIAVAVTGIAGPGGGNAEKPVGLVYFASLRRGETAIGAKEIFAGDRAEIRKRATYKALEMIHNHL